uniref:Mitochondrial import receptor subunit TOM22 homolog n=3 Tax=Palaeognathae TaxID=8783 RepID=A0A8B9PSH9_APTOW
MKDHAGRLVTLPGRRPEAPAELRVPPGSTPPRPVQGNHLRPPRRVSCGHWRGGAVEVRAGAPGGRVAGAEPPRALPAARGRCLSPPRAGAPPPSGAARLHFRCGRLRAPAPPVLVVMAAAVSLSPEELLPKGGSGKAEELEDELEEEDDDEELDETLAERLWGLTEMFPESVRSAAGATFDLSVSVAQKMYRFSRAALWIGTTSFMILVLPVVFETEKLQMEQQQQLQQRQILLGPNTGLSGGMPGALPPFPGKI